ncbi:hypothetical protein OKW40_000632 [Paraburkholderia sp. RAU6.4a]
MKRGAVRAAFDIRIAAEKIVAGRELIGDLLIETKQVAVAYACKEPITAELRHAFIVITRAYAKRQPVFGLQHDVGRVGGLTGRKNSIDPSVRIRVEHRKSLRDRRLQDRSAGLERHFTFEKPAREVGVAAGVNPTQFEFGNGDTHDTRAHVLFRHVDVDERLSRRPITRDHGAAYLGEAAEGQRLVEVRGEALQEGGVEYGQSLRDDTTLLPRRCRRGRAGWFEDEPGKPLDSDPCRLGLRFRGGG